MYKLKGIMILCCLSILSPQYLYAFIEKEVEILTPSGTNLYTIPIGESSTDGYGNPSYAPLEIEDFYVKENGVVVYVASDIAAQLFATGNSLAHLLGYPFLDASNDVSQASYDAQNVISDLTTSQRNEGAAAAAASVTGGLTTSWVLGLTVCGTSALTGIGAVPGCVGGAAIAIGGTVLTIVDWFGTVYDSYNDSAQVINEAEKAYFTGQALMNEGFTLQIQEVEPFVENISFPVKVSDIETQYRNLGLVAMYYTRAMQRFEATGYVDGGSAIKKIVGSWAIGSIPGASTVMGLHEYITDGDSKEQDRAEFLADIQQEMDRVASVDIFAEIKQDEFKQYFNASWSVPEPPLPNIDITLTVEDGDQPGQKEIYVYHGEGLLIRDLYSYRFDFGDGEGFYSAKGFNNVSVPQNVKYHTYSENDTYAITVEFVATDGRSSFASKTITVSNAPVNIEYTPSARRISPDYSTDHVVGDEVEFEVRGFDVDKNLSHVIWSFDGPLQLEESDDRDNFGSNETEVGYETMTVKILGDNGGEHFYMYATVYDELGNASDTEKWVLEARQGYAPVFSNITPPAGEISLPLGQEQEFYITVSDADGNAGDVIWKVNGTVVDEDGCGGGDPASIENYDFQVYERGLYTLTAEIQDDDGESSVVEWTITAGSTIDGNIAPTIDYFALDPDEIPYTTFRVGKPYEFEFVANDLDSNLVELSLYLDDILVRQDQRNSGTDSDNISEIISFPSSGTHYVKATATDQGSLLTEQTLTLIVLEADGTEGTAPQFSDIYPSSSSIYLESGNALYFGGNLDDPDWDQDHIDVYLNDNLIKDADISGDSNFYFSVSYYLFPTSGTHQIKLVPVDAGGKEGAAKTWTLVIGNGTHSPSIKRAIPNVNEPIYVLSDNSNHPTIYVFAEDQDGDLDRVEFDWSGVADSDPSDDTSLYRHFDIARGTFVPTKSGIVRATVYDEGGRSSSVDFNVVVVDSLGSNPPEILNCNIPDGAEYQRITGDSGYDVNLSFDAYDPDGDLQSIELFKNGVLHTSHYGINDYEDDGSFLSNADDAYYDRFEGPDNRSRGDRSNFLLRLTDSQGNVTEKNFSVTQGPVGDNNHAPKVQENISISVDQRASVTFQVPISDEEGDKPTALVLGVPYGHTVQALTYNEFLYTPDPSFFGTVTFSLSWNDGFGGTDTTTVTATVNFVPVTHYDVNISKSGTGFGVIISNPSGVNCDTACSASSGEFLIDSSMSLTATAASGSVFEGWEGDGSAILNVCSIYVNSPKNTMAIFSLDSDGDGMSDEWEITNNLNPQLDDAGLDPDQDGYTNLEEYANGTDPQITEYNPPPVIPAINMLLLSQ